MSSEADSREIALEILDSVFEKKNFLHIELRRAFAAHPTLDKTQKAFIKRVCQGTTERLTTIDAVIDSFSKVKVKKQKPFIRTLLRMSVYQIMYMDSVPDSAAVNEAVKLAKKHAFNQLSGFVNGVLRSVARKYKELELPENVKFSSPKWLYELFKNQYPDSFRDVFEAFLSHADKGTVIRLNRSRLEDEDKFVRELNAEPVCKELSLYRLTDIEGVESVKGFKEGLFSIQDPAATLAVHLGGVKQGSICLDMCAAPGGKTIQLADELKGTGHVISRDISEAKLPLIEAEVKRCGFNNIIVQAADASHFNEADVDKYDIVLADVPCSGLGVIGTKPDIKINVTPEGLESLAELQKRILECAVRYVKSGGTLIYSTCTLNRAENEDMVRWILEKNPGFERVDIGNRIPREFKKFYVSTGEICVLPKIGLCEGFFVAVLRRG